MKWSVIGKVISPTVIHVQTILAAMRPAWRNPRGLRGRSVGDNIFVAGFLNQGDKEHALDGSPWMVGKHAVLLQEYNGDLRLTDIRFDNMSIWVRILNLPFDGLVG